MVSIAARAVIPAKPETELSTARVRKIAKTLAAPAISITLALAAWYAVSMLVLSEGRRFLLPPPHVVFTESLADPKKLEVMGEALAVTARVALTGLLISAVLGVAIAVLMSQAKPIENVVYPYAVVLQAIPVLAVVPLIGLWLGYGFAARTTVCVLIAIHPIIAMTLFGIKSVDANLRELFTLGRAGRLRRLWSLQLPAALPSTLTGLRTAAGLSVTGAIIGDMFFAQGKPGIGTLLDTYRARLQSEDLIGALLLAALFGVLVFTVFTLIQTVSVGRWHDSAH
ncbi:ABC transporter permease [Nocardia rosealba]|uniref:ABC transporter permease n=1 Tax=Nocardia rosealba TaxID=2878563 RepID=UPI001CD9B2A6|nr:ABC transporter permease subunit [Nocardia rosealba]MCA2205811.1 ABC transporter permease subunit [Nocardia rosealba]